MKQHILARFHSLLIYRQGKHLRVVITLLLFSGGFSITWGDSLCWDPPLTSCAGFPADITAYDVSLSWLSPTLVPCDLLQCGDDCDPQAPGCCFPVADVCTFYSRSAWVDVDRVLPPATCTDWRPPDPQLGEVALIQVVAENGNGRGPMGDCP